VGVAPTLWRRWKAGTADAPAIAFATRAALAIVIFFTCSASKRPQYILPAMVPLSLLAATGIAANAARAASVLRASVRWVVLPLVVLVLVAGLSGWGMKTGDFRSVTPSVLIAGGMFVLVWGAVVVASRRPALALACCALFAPGLGIALLG